MELTMNNVIKESFTKGLKYVVPLFVNTLLWGLTVWIPYLNIGTTIGLLVGIMTKISRDEEVLMTEIFDPKYRKYMGEFFLTSGLLVMGIQVGTLFFVIPGIVIRTAWSLALPLVIDKNLNPTEALTKSNDLTYGKKWVIWGAPFVISLLLCVALWIVAYILGLIHPALAFLFVFFAIYFILSVMISAKAVIYGSLTKDV